MIPFKVATKVIILSVFFILPSSCDKALPKPSFEIQNEQSLMLVVFFWQRRVLSTSLQMKVVTEDIFSGMILPVEFPSVLLRSFFFYS